MRRQRGREGDGRRGVEAVKAGMEGMLKGELGRRGRREGTEAVGSEVDATQGQEYKYCIYAAEKKREWVWPEESGQARGSRDVRDWDLAEAKISPKIRFRWPRSRIRDVDALRTDRNRTAVHENGAAASRTARWPGADRVKQLRQQSTVHVRTTRSHRVERPVRPGPGVARGT